MGKQEAWAGAGGGSRTLRSSAERGGRRTYPRSTRHACGAPLRTGDNICPHAPRLRRRQPIWREQGGNGRRYRSEATPSGGERREKSRGACGQAVTGVRSERGRRDAIASRWPHEAETPEGEECVPPRCGEPRRVRGRANGVSTGKALAVGIQAEAAGSP